MSNILYAVTKFLGFITSPLCWVVLLLIIGVAFQIKRRKKALVFQLAALTILIIFTNPFLSNYALYTWEKPFSEPKTFYEKRHAIVLSGMVSFNPANNQHNFGQSTDRITETIKLYFSNKIDKVILTGGNASIFYHDKPEAEVLKDFLVQLNIPDTSIIIENRSRNTFENALYTSKIIDSLKDNRTPLLITSGYHIKRAMACFERQNIEVIPFGVDIYHPYVKTDFEHLFMPSVQALQQWNILFHEWIGLLFYSIKGYI